MRLLSLVVFILISIESFSQSYLNDSTRFGGVGSTISSVFEVDTGYYLAAGRFSIEHGNTSEIVLGYIDDAGFSSVVVDFDTLNNQWVYSSVSKLVQNERGNFVIRYKNCDTVSCYPRIKEYTPEGVLVTDVNFRALIDSLNVGVLAFGDFIQKKDSTYVLLANTSYPSIGTALYIHLDENFNIIDAIHFIHPHVDWQYGSSNVIELPDGNTAIAISEVKFLNDIEGGVKMVIVDENDEVVKECFYIYNHKINIPLGLTNSIQNDGHLFSYVEEYEEDGDSRYNIKVCKIDTNCNLVWQKKVREEKMTVYSQFLMQPEIKPTFDSSYVIVGAYTHPDYSYSVGTAQLTKFTEQGEFLWQRNNFITDTIQHAIEMRDVIQSSDSGFVMVGALTESGVQKGYVVKTNCLGFLGEPVASASHIIEQDYEVVFYNTSMQAGSYTWYFGDGDSLLTNEYVDTLFHTYADSGSYQVQLVAHGCNGRADTIEFDVFIAAEIDTFKVIHGNAYFTIFPNPSATNDDIYIYLNELDPDQGVVWLDAITMTGQLADQVNLSPMEGSYQIHSDLASGVYVLTLYQGDRRLQQEKLVVK